eukprot:g43209.t1
MVVHVQNELSEEVVEAGSLQFFSSPVPLPESRVISHKSRGFPSIYRKVIGVSLDSQGILPHVAMFVLSLKALGFGGIEESVGPLKDNGQNLCMEPEEVGGVPEDWKIANVVPLFKKGNRNDPGNYRSMTLTSVGSVLGPLLLVIYRNDLEENVAGLVSKFVDDTKIGGVADSEEDSQRIQQDIYQLEAWAEKWQMEFNPDKCEV